jgi:signal peptidase I
MRGRRLRRIAAAFVTVAGLTIIVALSTNEVHLVTTHGISMEPRFHTGDLAVIVPSAQYRVGDIVGYHSPLLHIVVLHRIVAEHAGLFTFKGDNNSFLDPVRLPPSAIEGRLWVHVVHGGDVLGWLRSPVILGLLAFFVMALGVGGVSHRRRSRTPAGGGKVTHERGPSGAVGQQWWPIAVAVGLVFLFGLFTAASWNRPATRPSGSPLAYVQSGRFSYSATAPVGVTYPDGTVTTGDAVFLHLVKTLDVTFHYALGPSTKSAVSGVSVAAKGTIGATATVKGSGGWTGPLATQTPVRFSGTSATVTVALDLAQIPDVETSFTTQTGVPLVDPQIVVTPVVHIEGTIDGVALRQTFETPLNFQVVGGSLTVLGTSAGGGGPGDPAMSVVRSGSVVRPIKVPAQVSVLGHAVSVLEARRLSLGGLALSILAALGTWAWWVRRRRMDETDRIHASYGHDLVSVSASPVPRAPLVVDVETFAQLAQLARRYDCVILEHAHADGHGYYVESGATIYRCGVEPVTEPSESFEDSDQYRGSPSVAVGSASEFGIAPTPPRSPWSMPAHLEADMADMAGDVEMLTCLGKAEWVSGVGNAGGHLREAFILAKKAGLVDMMITALLVNVRTAFDETQVSDLEKIELLEYSLARSDLNPALRARVLGALAIELIFVGDTRRRCSLLDEARELTRGCDDPVSLVDVSMSYFVARPRSSWAASQLHLDRSRHEAAEERVALLDSPSVLATMQHQAAAYAFIEGDGPQLRSRLTALDGSSDHGANQVAVRAQLLWAQTIATLEGRLTDAEDLSIEAVDLRRRTGLVDADKVRRTEQLAIRREQSRLDEVIDDIADHAVDRPWTSAPVAALAFALIETGQDDQAALLLTQARQEGFASVPDDADWPLAVALWCEVAARFGDVEAAAALHGLLETQDTLALCTDGISCGPASRLLALLEQVLDRPADADRHFAEAVEFSSRLDSTVWTARCTLDWAEMWATWGETAWAGHLVDKADDAMGSLELPALRQQSADLRLRIDQN